MCIIHHDNHLFNETNYIKVNVKLLIVEIQIYLLNMYVVLYIVFFIRNVIRNVKCLNAKIKLSSKEIGHMVVNN